MRSLELLFAVLPPPPCRRHHRRHQKIWRMDTAATAATAGKAGRCLRVVAGSAAWKMLPSSVATSVGWHISREHADFRLRLRAVVNRLDDFRKVPDVLLRVRDDDGISRLVRHDRRLRRTNDDKSEPIAAPRRNGSG